MKKFSGKALRERREAVGLSQGEVAVALSVERKRPVGSAVISRYERDMTNPSADVLSVLASVLKCSIDHFYAEKVQQTVEPLNRKRRKSNGKRVAAA